MSITANTLGRQNLVNSFEGISPGHDLFGASAFFVSNQWTNKFDNYLNFTHTHPTLSVSKKTQNCSTNLFQKPRTPMAGSIFLETATKITSALHPGLQQMLQGQSHHFILKQTPWPWEETASLSRQIIRDYVLGDLSDRATFGLPNRNPEGSTKNK